MDTLPQSGWPVTRQLDFKRLLHSVSLTMAVESALRISGQGA